MSVTPSAMPRTDSIALRNISWETYEMLRRDTDEDHLFITYDEGRMVLDRRGGDVGVIEHVSWETYERLLRETEAQKLRLSYDQGSLAIVSPTHRHHKVAALLGMMIESTAIEFRVTFACFGSATWRHPDVWQGLEADECYYVQNEHLVRGKEEIDLETDPPPDLALEVEITHQDIDRFKLYAALGVPEVWHFKRERLRALKLESDSYREIETSVALPMLRPADLQRFLAMRTTTDVTSIMLGFREWLRTLQADKLRTSNARCAPAALPRATAPPRPR